MEFEEGILQRHRKIKTGLASYIFGSRPLLVITAPVIYAPLLAFVLLDSLVTAYQLVCFPIYGIPRVRRHDYLLFDRYQLVFLNAIEKINCLYCSYANGLLASWAVSRLAGCTSSPGRWQGAESASIRSQTLCIWTAVP